MRRRLTLATLSAVVLCAPLALVARQQPAPAQPAPQQTPQKAEFETPPMPVLPNNGLGDTDQPVIPGQPWRTRDLNRPKPAAVTPARHLGDPPSDAVILFDGKDLSQWTAGGGGRGRAGAQPGAAAPPPTPPPAAPSWKVQDGYMEVSPTGGSLTSKERFRDFQLHLEFATPPVPLGISQYRGNSGVTIGGREIQILDNYDNATYADGYVAAVYSQWPPLSNPSLPPGQWQTLDIAYMAARYEGDTLVRNPFITIFLNGVMVQNNREIQPPAPRGAGPGPVGGRAGAGAAGAPAQPAAAGAARGPAVAPGGDQAVGLMGHPSAIPGNAVRYRNVWARRVQVDLPTSTTSAGAGPVR